MLRSRFFGLRVGLSTLLYCSAPKPRAALRLLSSFTPLRWKNGRYNSVIISVEGSVQQPEFSAQLDEQLREWRASGKGAVWLELAASQGALISAAAAAGFRFHHAEGDACSMLLWLQERPCPVPPFATHNVGVGGVVIDRERRILLVKDRGARIPGQWKFPGGLAHVGEGLCTAAVREVAEETGVDSAFRSVLAFRELHGAAFGRSDLYIICHLDALSTEIRIDPVEIEDACWMPSDDFVRTTSHPLARFAAQLAGAEHDAATGAAAERIDGGTAAGAVFVEETVHIPTLQTTARCFRGAGAGSIAGAAHPQ